MKTPTEFSYRKFKRKTKAVGYNKAIVSAIELASRRIVLWPIVDRLCDYGVVQLLSSSEFRNQSNFIVNITEEKEEYGSLTAPFVADIGSGYVLTETGLITTDDVQIINANLHPIDRGRRFVVAKLIWQLFFENMRLTSGLVRKNPALLDINAASGDCVAPLIPRYFDNYYHWMIETVPKIRYLREFESEMNAEVKYLLPKEAPSWVEQTLTLLEVPKSKVEYASSSVYKCSRLVVPSFPLRVQSDYNWIVDRVLKNATPDREEIGAGNNIYISRAKAVERQVTNEDEVVEALSQYGFKRHLLEDHNVAENATLFNEADIIVGAHGAGLTDLIYCKDATVIELFGSKIKQPYKQLAETMSVNYKPVKCTPKSTDIYVDPDTLCSTVESVL